MATIKFTIKKDGTVLTDVNGIIGRGCEDLSRIFTDALGIVQSIEEKSEMYDEIETIEQMFG